MSRALALIVIVLGACSTAHPAGTSDGATGGADSRVSSDGATADAPPGTADAPPGSVDAPPGTADAPPGTIDAMAMIDASTLVDANGCSVQPCTLDPQCGCPTNQSCDIDPTDLMGNVCRAINVAGTETDTCTSFSECDKGYVCIGDGTDNSCKRYCTTDAECGTPRGQCVIQIVDGSSNAIPGAVVCSSNCDPAGNAGAYCPSGYKCGIFSATFPYPGGTSHDIADCTPAGAGGQGTTCTGTGQGDDTLCGPKTLCTTFDGSTFACNTICNRSAGGTECAALGLTCYGFTTPLTIGGTEYGVCN
jgi:hypothetical protein